MFFEAKKKGFIIDAVVHFAGLKSVQESIDKPLLYWRENLFGTLNLLEVMSDFLCNKIVFSSSATVYGNNHNVPIKETSEIKPVNTYGQTKAVIEKFLKDVQEELDSKFNIAVLRFFNPVGAHHSGLIGELPLGTPNNIFPFLKL